MNSVVLEFFSLNRLTSVQKYVHFQEFQLGIYLKRNQLFKPLVFVSQVVAEIVVVYM